MYMELPERFKLSFAEVVEGELLFHRVQRFEDVMYELTYALRKKKCTYCGRELNRNESTLDHRYPKATGGVSITNNLFPCCPKCNSSKSNLTHEEYLRKRELSKKESVKYLKDIAKYNETIMRKIGFKLPKKWVTYEDVSNIAYRCPVDILRGKRYHRIQEFCQQYKKLPGPIIIDEANKLLDGFNILLYAKDRKIERIPVIKLENVELLLD